MLSWYGFEFEEKEDNNTHFGNNPAATGADVALAPLYFMWPGENYSGSYIFNAGFFGSVWSSTYAAYMHVRSNRIMPDVENRFTYLGLSLRAVNRKRKIFLKHI